MTIMQAINEVDNLKPNMYELPEKIKWLSRLDRRIFENILCTHVLSEEEMEPYLPDGGGTMTYVDPNGRWRTRPLLPEERLRFTDYTEADTDKELIVGEPYDELYIHWLSAQIDLNNREDAGFNASNSLFESVYGSFRNSYNRTHMPKGRDKIYY